MTKKNHFSIVVILSPNHTGLIWLADKKFLGNLNGEPFC